MTRTRTQLGGWDPNILAENTDLTFRIYRAGYKIKYVNDTECYERLQNTWTRKLKKSLWNVGNMKFGRDNDFGINC